MSVIKNTKEYSRANAKTPRAGFTLIEILVVLAITSILLLLIFKPLIDSFNLTSRAGTQIESQAAARNTMRQIDSLLGNAVFVFDNTQTPLTLWFGNNAGEPFALTTQYTMVEYVAPARQLDQIPGNTPIDPTTGQPIYTGLPPGQTGYALPLTPGRALGRLWIGLQNNVSELTGVVDETGRRLSGKPVKLYGNRFSDPAIGTNNDNRYLLYRAEVLTFVPNPDNLSGAYVPNLGLFHTKDASGDIVDTLTGRIELHDPNFFYDSGLAGDSGSKGARKWAVPGWRDLNGDGQVQIFENWRAAASSMIPLNKADMVELKRDDSGNIVYTDGRPSVRPLTIFAPSFVQNDPAVPATLGDAGNESPTAVATTFTSQKIHWAMPFRVLVYRSDDNTDPLTRNPLDYYELDSRDMRIFHKSAVPGSDGTPVEAGDVGPQLVNGVFSNPSATKFAFTVDPQRGLINFAFPSGVMVYDSSNKPLPQFYSPANINAALNPSNPYGKRFLDLRVLPPSPLYSVSAASPLADGTNWAANARIVPGSEQVYGPDQRPGPNYGYRVLYSRVSANAGFVGTNQYKINYENIRNMQDASDPRQRIGYIEFNSLPDTGSLEQPNLLNYDPGSTAAAMENPANGSYRRNGLPQARFNRVTGMTEAASPVEVTYSFQMNRPNDIVKIDYMTRELMNVTLEARLYDPATGRPEFTALTQKVKVRNLQR